MIFIFNIIDDNSGKPIGKKLSVKNIDVENRYSEDSFKSFNLHGDSDYGKVEIFGKFWGKNHLDGKLSMMLTSIDGNMEHPLILNGNNRLRLLDGEGDLIKLILSKSIKENKNKIKVVRLTESDVERLVKRIIKEDIGE